MSKQFFIWKDPACDGIDPQWIEISGIEFYRLIKAPENKDRHFVTLGNDGDDEAGIIVVEATAENFKAWRSDARAALRRRKINATADITIVPLDTPITTDEECLLSETLIDEDGDFMEKLLLKEDISMLKKALDMLSPAEMRIVDALYFSNHQNHGEREIARQLGTYQMMLNRQKKKILEKLKDFMFQNRKPLAN